MLRDQRPPGDERGRPGKGGPVSPSPTKIESTITPRYRGCPCGCQPGDDCIADRPAPVVVNDGCHCGRLGLDGIRAAATLGMYCSAGHCAYVEMRVAS